MGLSSYKVGAGLAVSDMHGARGFYEGKLGLSVSIDSGDNVRYRCAEGTVMHVYLSPEHAGKSTATPCTHREAETLPQDFVHPVGGVAAHAGHPVGIAVQGELYRSVAEELLDVRRVRAARE